MKAIVFAGGCFWGVENYFNQVKGVIKTRVGYTAGFIDFPTYRQVCSGETGHTEACIIHYNPNETNLRTLLEHFFNIVDPTLIDQQGPDIGSQYRSGIYYYCDEDREEIESYIDSIRQNYQSEIVTEVKQCDDFWEAEDYHQKYLDKNPEGYCHIQPEKFYCSIKIDYGNNNKGFAMCMPVKRFDKMFEEHEDHQPEESKISEENNLNQSDNENQNFEVKVNQENNDTDQIKDNIELQEEIIEESKENNGKEIVIEKSLEKAEDNKILD